LHANDIRYAQVATLMHAIGNLFILSCTRAVILWKLLTNQVSHSHVAM